MNISDEEKVRKNLVMGHKGVPDTKINWPTAHRQ
jgi:hypothetical protein